MARKKSKSAKKAQAGQTGGAEETYKKAPHTFVIPRGQVGRNINQLIQDMRRVMEPFTAANLKVKKRNVLQDFVTIAGTLNVTHIVMYTKTETATYMRLVRLPRGPTLTFRIHGYTLSADVISSLRRHNMEAKQFDHHPLLVMNNFSGDGMHMKLMASMFQNMFPSININKVKLNSIRRCVLLNYNSESEELEFRHYNIRAVPVGMSRGVKKLIKAKVPNMANFTDVSEFLLGGGDHSESEAEMDGPHNEVILPQELSSRGNIKAAKSAIRLTEIGPRMTLELIKIEEGICTGEVLYHKFIEKTEAEKIALKEKHSRKKKLKEQRKKHQEENVKRKEEQKQENKKRSLAGMKKKDGEGDSDAAFSEDDDVEYFKKEVGHNPEPELFPKKDLHQRKRRSTEDDDRPFKKKKFGDQKNFGDKKKPGGENSAKKHRTRKDMTPVQKILERKKKKMKAKLKGKPGARKKRAELRKSGALESKRRTVKKSDAPDGKRRTDKKSDRKSDRKFDGKRPQKPANKKFKGKPR